MTVTTRRKIPDEGEVRFHVAKLSGITSLKTQIYETLRRSIMSMNIYDDRADLRLDERSLSMRLGISRTPLREALSRLDQEGLVRIVPRQGVFIVRKSKKEILEMITVWAALEGMAARLVVDRASAGTLAELRRIHEGFTSDRAAEQLDDYSDANIAFHQQIIALSECTLIASMSEQLFMHVRAIRQRTISQPGRLPKSIEDHYRIIEALEQRDEARAENLVRDHTLRLRDHVDRWLDLP